jgi:hypothetical protein
VGPFYAIILPRGGSVLHDHFQTIYDRSFVPVATHLLFPRGATAQRSHLKEHDPPRDAQQRSEQLAGRFAEFGPAGSRFLEGLLAAARYGRNPAERVLTLAAAYPRGDVIAALERAVQYGAFSRGAIQRILAARSQPKAPLDFLIEDHRTYLESLLELEPTPPRPTSDYQALLGQGPDDGEPRDHPAEANHPIPELCGEDRDITPVD